MKYLYVRLLQIKLLILFIQIQIFICRQNNYTFSNEVFRGYVHLCNKNWSSWKHHRKWKLFLYADISFWLKIVKASTSLRRLFIFIVFSWLNKLCLIHFEELIFQILQLSSFYYISLILGYFCVILPAEGRFALRFRLCHWSWFILDEKNKWTTYKVFINFIISQTINL